MPRLTQRFINTITAPDKNHSLFWDDDITGFGFRITKSGAKSFVLRYVINGRERKITIGKYPDLSAIAAREEAIKLRAQVTKGHDPLEERSENRAASNIAELAESYLNNHANRVKRQKSIIDDKNYINNVIIPAFGKRKIKEVKHKHIQELHYKLKDTPYKANRVLALLSKMFSLAVKWEWCQQNPVIGIERYEEEKRDRWLNMEEAATLMQVLSEHPNQRAANAVRLLLLTGARKSEVLNAEWSHIDLARGVWHKPSNHTKQKKKEHVPLNEAVIALLTAMYKERTQEQFLFPGNVEGKPLQEIKRFWKDVCQKAELQNVRIHDLRHTYASHLVSSGVPLFTVGRLLGHTQASTTERYSHLSDASLRQATNQYSKLFTHKPSPAKVEN